MGRTLAMMKRDADGAANGDGDGERPESGKRFES